MKTQDEIHRAHDLMSAVILGELPMQPARQRDRENMQLICSALCWVLGDDHPPGKNVQNVLDTIEAWAKASGFELKKFTDEGMHTE